MAEYSVGMMALPEWGIKSVTFEGNGNEKAIVTFDDGQESFVEDTIDPFQVADLRELVGRRPELLVVISTKTQQQEVPAEQSITYQQAREIATGFVKSEQISDHEVTMALVTRMRPINNAAASEVMEWHRGWCRTHYLTAHQETCCYGAKEEAANQAALRQFQSGPWRSRQWS